MTSNGAKHFEKIPYSITPINYDILFHPNPVTFKFNGSQKIDIEVKERVDTVKLNASELEVRNVSCNSKSATVTLDTENQIVILKFPEPLELGKTVLSMEFTGTHNDQMKGFYRSSYKTLSGETRYNLTTQMEACSARMAFPCIDEPDRKATFCISMVVPSNKVALSNMPEIKREKVERPADLPTLDQGAHYEMVSFSKSPIMSTYLLAMVVGDFECIEDVDSNGVKIRVYAPPERKHCCQFAMDVAKKSLPFYSECFGIAYPLPKLDLIAIPDFAAGAMENWGLVTYRETALLIDPVESSLALKQRVALVVAHELAHMWFGNLVTMKWWTHLWLNEGFATWMEYLCVDKVCPDFDIWTTFTTSELSTALTLDALKSSHPIEVEVGHPDEVDEIFDSISYAKGASIINMLYNWIGHDSFFCGLRAYIDKFKYSNTQTEDLWDALGTASRQSVCDVMSEWTRKMGYPVLSVSVDSSSNSLCFSQKRFLADGSSSADAAYTWPVPFSVTTGKQQQKITHLLRPDQQSTWKLQLPADFKASEVLVNPGRSSFVRVHYSADMMQGVKRMLTEGLLGPRDRLAILDDHFSLCLAGQLPLSDVIDLLEAYAGESHHIVWDSITSGVSHVRMLMEEYATDHAASPEQKQDAEAALAGLARLCQKLALPVFKKLGWDPLSPTEEHNDTFLRTQILAVLARSGLTGVLQEAKTRFQSHVDSVLSSTGDIGKQVNSNIRGTVYATILRHGGQTEYDALLKLYRNSTMSDERVRVLQCLGVSQCPELRQKTLAFVLTEEVRKQDRYAGIVSLCSSGPQGRRQYWEFVKSNIVDLPDHLGSPNLLTHVLKNSCRHFAHPTRLQEVKEFWAAHPQACKRAIEQAIEEIEINTSQLARDGPGLIAKLKTL